LGTPIRKDVHRSRSLRYRSNFCPRARTRLFDTPIQTSHVPVVPTRIAGTVATTPPQIRTATPASRYRFLRYSALRVSRIPRFSRFSRISRSGVVVEVREEKFPPPLDIHPPSPLATPVQTRKPGPPIPPRGEDRGTSKPRLRTPNRRRKRSRLPLRRQGPGPRQHHASTGLRTNGRRA